MEFVEQQGLAIVANGAFNPSIFHPSWMLHQGIITDGEADAAAVELVHPELSRFRIPGMMFEVQSERFTLRVDIEPFVRAADVFFALFGEKLSHTPITTVGVNYVVHVQLADYQQRQKFGRILAPIGPWGEFGQRMDVPERERQGGFSTLVMRASYPEFGEEGATNVTIQPSILIPNNAGAYIMVNNHFSEDKAKDIGFGEVIRDNFDAAIQNSRNIIQHLIHTGRGIR